jgi:3-oxoacyl-[acyl-carrier-protein] synthase-1
MDSRFKPFIVGGVPDDGLPELHSELAQLPIPYREARMLRLAEIPMQEAMVSFPKGGGSITLLMGLPEHQTTVPLKPKDFLDRLAKQGKVALNIASSKMFPQGRSGGLMAVKEGVERLMKNQSAFCLVGGVDSYLDVYVLGTLDMQKRVRTEANADGFTPGEGAGFLLLTTGETAGKLKLKVLGRLLAAAVGKEPGYIYSEEPYKGEGLAQTFESLFSAAGSTPPVACIYAGFNGERHWAKELGVAVLRHRPRFAEGYQMEHPAECFGDLGAAHGPVMLGLACLGMQAGFRPSPTLVYASSDFGDQAAVLVAKA